MRKLGIFDKSIDAHVNFYHLVGFNECIRRVNNVNLDSHLMTPYSAKTK